MITIRLNVAACKQRLTKGGQATKGNGPSKRLDEIVELNPLELGNDA